ncbi:MAG: amidohydrolase family protein [Gemmatimonadales bacterium]
MPFNRRCGPCGRVGARRHRSTVPRPRAGQFARLRPSGSAAAGLLVLLAAAPAAAQNPRVDRFRWLDSTTTVTDDPRRLPVPAGFNAPAGTIVLRGGLLWDGTGAPARAATVVVTGSRVASVLPPNATGWPRDAEVIDIAGKLVMPGLIDLHTHLDYRMTETSDDRAWSPADGALRGLERLRYFIESGITTVRDVASAGDTPFLLKRWLAEGRIVGPRVLAAGSLITGRGGHGAEVDVERGRPLPSVVEASGPDEWRQAVREQFRKGADLIKVASHFSEAEIHAAVEEAHELGLKVTADAETFYIERAVHAGVDMIEHPLPRTDETIRLMKDRGTAADPTLIPYHIIFSLSGGYFGTTSRRFTFSDSANRAVVRRMKEAGIPLGIGTDLVVDWYRYLPWPYLEELRQVAALGFTTQEVLTMATRGNAELLDMGERLGTIVPGKLADLLVVAGRPDQRLDDLTRVDLVIRDGRVQVRDGRIYQARHVPAPPPAATNRPGSEWNRP